MLLEKVEFDTGDLRATFLRQKSAAFDKVESTDLNMINFGPREAIEFDFVAS